jgi:hypothetical protein
MSKKNLLNEATIRRFMKLADMEPLTSPFVDRLEEMHCPSGGRDDDEPMEERQGYDDREDEAESARLGKIADKDVSKAGRRADVRGKFGDRHGGPVTEDAHEEDELDATEHELGDEDAEADRERDELDDLEADDADGDIPADVRDRIEDALAAALEDLADKLDLDLDVEREDDAAPEMDAEPEAEVAIDVEDDDDAVEVDAMLENVEVVDDSALISEVAKRVTARLVKAMAKK